MWLWLGVSIHDHGKVKSKKDFKELYIKKVELNLLIFQEQKCKNQRQYPIFCSKITVRKS